MDSVQSCAIFGFKIIEWFVILILLNLPSVVVVTIKVSCMVFNATFNNISVISWWTVLLVEETGVPGENYPPVTGQTLSHNVESITPRPRGILITMIVVMGTNCIGSYKSNYHAITTTTIPRCYKVVMYVAIM